MKLTILTFFQVMSVVLIKAFIFKDLDLNFVLLVVILTEINNLTESRHE